MLRWYVGEELGRKGESVSKRIRIDYSNLNRSQSSTVH